MIRLGVNIDHIATLRQARGGVEPDPVWGAVQAELGGADGITFHVREDRRHMQDHDVRRLQQTVTAQLNFELAVADDVIALAFEIQPQMAMFVPENRAEITTEGGLDVKSQIDTLGIHVSRFRNAGIRTSAFIDADADQIDAAHEVGFDVCEIHTGPYAQSVQQFRDLAHSAVVNQVVRIVAAGDQIQSHSMQFNAGHGLNYLNVQPIAALDGVQELHIGHSIISRSVFSGLTKAVAEMKRLMMEAAHHPQAYRVH